MDNIPVFSGLMMKIQYLTSKAFNNSRVLSMDDAAPPYIATLLETTGNNSFIQRCFNDFR